MSNKIDRRPKPGNGPDRRGASPAMTIDAALLANSHPVNPLFRHRLLAWLAGHKRPVASYFIRTPHEKRALDRKRMRLRSGKIISADLRFLAECLVFDCSAAGARLLLQRDAEIPDVIWLFDDNDQSLVKARVAWTLGHQIGVRFSRTTASQLSRKNAARFGGKLYALPD